jgi:spore germination protein YaaH
MQVEDDITMRRAKALLIFFIVILLIPAGCGGRPEADVRKGAGGLGAWVVYWDCDNVSEEIESLGDNLQNISYFAAYFDKNNQLFVPEQATKVFKKVRQSESNRKYTNYLSIVNDKINSDGKTSLKSTDLLQELFSDDKTVDRHIENIVDIAVSEGYDGVEIDYEAIKKDTVLWNKFLNFTKKLYKRLNENHLKMRIDLEASSPVDMLKFPEGPEYIIMCYNLYGATSEPGPKADIKFIADLADKMSCLPGKKVLAFATGGFDWAENEKAKAMTEQQAVSLQKQYSITPLRDESSQALTFKYTDDSGKKHEVWFADGATLTAWMKSAENKSFGISLWRLNGNREESLKQVSGAVNNPDPEKKSST